MARHLGCCLGVLVAVLSLVCHTVTAEHRHIHHHRREGAGDRTLRFDGSQKGLLKALERKISAGVFKGWLKNGHTDPANAVRPAHPQQQAGDGADKEIDLDTLGINQSTDLDADRKAETPFLTKIDDEPTEKKCHFDHDCGEGYFCDVSDASDGYSCQRDGEHLCFCRKRPKGMCKDNSECEKKQVCIVFPTHSGAGVCMNHCKSDDECPNGSVCFGVDEMSFGGYCVDPDTRGKKHKHVTPDPLSEPLVSLLETAELQPLSREEFQAMPVEGLEDKRGMHCGKKMTQHDEDSSIPFPARSAFSFLQMTAQNANKCPQHVCDWPQVRDGYTKPPQKHTIRLHFHIVKDSKGNKIADSKIQGQLTTLLEAYQLAGFKFRTKRTVYKSDFLAAKRLHTEDGCEINEIGDGKCQPECDYKDLAYDGGDCPSFKPTTSQNTISKCQKASRNNVCDQDCNTKQFQWDGGDCCNVNAKGQGESRHQECLDPSSANKAYISVSEWKQAITQANGGALGGEWFHIFLVPIFLDHQTMGFSEAFPWDSNFKESGLVIYERFIGPGQKTMVHEFGHSMGLWHTFHGTEEVRECGACADGMGHPDVTGDFCSDTPPTPTNFDCKTPEGQNECDKKAWAGSVHDNYMGYAPDSCMKSFSKHQKQRMWCFADKSHLKSWLE